MAEAGGAAACARLSLMVPTGPGHSSPAMLRHCTCACSTGAEGEKPGTGGWALPSLQPVLLLLLLLLLLLCVSPAPPAPPLPCTPTPHSPTPLATLASACRCSGRFSTLQAARKASPLASCDKSWNSASACASRAILNSLCQAHRRTREVPAPTAPCSAQCCAALPVLPSAHGRVMIKCSSRAASSIRRLGERT